jgi:hypothetical protein
MKNELAQITSELDALLTDMNSNCPGGIWPLRVGVALAKIKNALILIHEDLDKRSD